jgi:hypothetical protein
MVQRDYALPKLPVALPTTDSPDFIDAKAIGEKFESVLNSFSENALVQDAVWRDSFIMTGTLRTFYSSQSIFSAWKETAKIRQPTNFVLDGSIRARKTWIDIGFTFKTERTPATRGYAYLSVILAPDGKWKIWILRTILEQIENAPNVDKLEPFQNAIQPQCANAPIQDGVVAKGTGSQKPVGKETSSNQDFGIHISNGIMERTHTSCDFFECVVVGGGQAGLGTGGRLKALGISYVILEKHVEVGDNWATRYDSTRCK